MSCRVWSTFQATREDGSLVKLRIQDLPENRIDDALHLFIKYFIHDEKLMKMTGISRNPKAVKEYQLFISELIKDPASLTMICCEDEEDDNVRQIMGVSLMLLTTVERQTLFKKLQLNLNLEMKCFVPTCGNDSNNSTKIIVRIREDLREKWCREVNVPYFQCYAQYCCEDHFDPETDEMRLFLQWETIFDSYKQLKELRMASFYDDVGVIIHPRFRKLGIATEFARARCSACVAHNVAATGALTTAIGTEKIAKKDHWDTVKEFKLADLGQHYGVTCEGVVARLVMWKNPEFKHDESEKYLKV